MRRVRKFNQVKQVVFYCGGLGTRLGNITKKTPKPLIKINQKPFIEHLFKNFSRFGIKNILLLCSYKYKFFFKKYHNKILNGALIKCVNEGPPKGTAGSLRQVKNKLDNHFLLCNGDTYFDINILELINIHKKNSMFNMALTVSDDNRYGGVKLNKNKIEIFDSKKNTISSRLVNGGLYYVRKELLNHINKKNFSIEKEILPNLAKKNKILGKKFTNKFLDIGVKKDLKKSSKFLKLVQKKPALFLDRDGVINKDLGYVHKYKNFIWLKNIKKLIKFANDNNYYVFVLTNQSGIGRGYYTKKDVDILHKKVNEELIKIGAHIDDFFCAPYFKDSKIYKFKKKDFLMRKPNIGMMLECKKKWDINIKKSILIGDQENDMLLAKKSKIKNRILVSKDVNIYKKFLKIFKSVNSR